MKKTLTENISRFDEKMRFRMDFNTVRAILISVVPAGVIGYLLSTLVSIVIGMPFALCLFLLLLLGQIGLVDGIPAYRFAAAVFKQNARHRFEYLHLKTDAKRFDPQAEHTNFPEDQDMKPNEKSKGKKKQQNTEQPLKTGQVGKKSAQSLIPFDEWYENGVFRLNENTYAIICSFANTGYLSKTDAEKTRKYNAYLAALASLPSYLHYEEVVSNRPVDRQTYLDAVAKSDTNETNLNPYAKAFFDVQKKFVSTVDREISLKRYLVALSVEVQPNESPFNKLLDGVTVLDGRFREMGSSLRILSPDEVFAELYFWNNPFGEKMPPIPMDLYRRGLTVKDLIAADGVKFGKKDFWLGDAYCRILTIHSYGREVNDTLLYTLLNNSLPVSVSKHIDHVGKEAAIKRVKKQLDELESRRQSRLAKNKQNGTTHVPLDLERAIEGCTQVLDALSGNEEFIRQTVFVTIRAESPEQLEEYSDRIVASALSEHCTLRPVQFFQEDAFKSVLPLGMNLLDRSQFLLSSEAAVMTPFAYESSFDANGFWYGRNGHSGEPVILNRKLGKSSNGFVFGVTGSGKGFFVKNEMTNVLYQPFTQTDEIIVVDATGEYIPLANAAGGKVVELTPSSDTHLNPLYISPAQLRTQGRQRAEASKIEHLIALFSQIKSGSGLDAVEKGIVDTVAARVFKKGKNVTLDGFYKELKAEMKAQPSLHKVIEEMCSWLKRYVEGSVTLFAGEDTEQSNGGTRFLVYSVRGLDGDLRNAGMLSMLERIESRVYENHEAGRWTWIYIDEMHRYFDYERNPYAASRFSRFYSEMRHYGAILTGITQLPLPVVQSKDGASMLSNSRFVVMAELDGSNIDAVTQLYDLNEDQQRTLASPALGQYVVRIHNAPTSVSMLYPGAREEDKNVMYDLFNTTFEGSENG